MVFPLQEADFPTFATGVSSPPQNHLEVSQISTSSDTADVLNQMIEFGWFGRTLGDLGVVGFAPRPLASDLNV